MKVKVFFLPLVFTYFLLSLFSFSLQATDEHQNDQYSYNTLNRIYEQLPTLTKKEKTALFVLSLVTSVYATNNIDFNSIPQTSAGECIEGFRALYQCMGEKLYPEACQSIAEEGMLCVNNLYYELINLSKNAIDPIGEAITCTFGHIDYLPQDVLITKDMFANITQECQLDLSYLMTSQDFNNWIGSILKLSGTSNSSCEI